MNEIFFETKSVYGAFDKESLLHMVLSFKNKFFQYKIRKVFKCLNNLNKCLKMLNIISKGYIDILRLFYVRKERLHLRAIAKKVNLNENSAFRFLNMLEKDSFLSSEKIGNMKLFSIKPSKKLFSVFSFFDVERFENLPSIRKNAIQIFLNDLSSPPVFVILFGSTAKGSFRKNSDVDVLIITNTIIDTNLAQKNANAQTALELNIFQITYSDFITELKMKEDLVIQSALESGFPVTNHIMFYEVLHNSKI